MEPTVAPFRLKLTNSPSLVKRLAYKGVAPLLTKTPNPLLPSNPTPVPVEPLTNALGLSVVPTKNSPLRVILAFSAFVLVLSAVEKKILASQ